MRIKEKAAKIHQLLYTCLPVHNTAHLRLVARMHKYCKGINSLYIFITMRIKEKAAKIHQLLYTCYQCI